MDILDNGNSSFGIPLWSLIHLLVLISLDDIIIPGVCVPVAR